MPRPHRRLVGWILALTIPALSLFGAPAHFARADVSRTDSATTMTTATTTTTVVVDNTYVYDLENEPSKCIGLLPQPNCGKKPEQAGDRGGALQYAVLALVLGALGIIGTVVGRNVVRRDRAMAESLKDAPNGR